MKKFLSVLGNIFVVLFLLVALAIMASVITSQKGDGLPDLYGYSPLSVQSDSMEPTLNKGDLIIIEKKIDYNNLKLNDIVTFYAFKDGQKYYDTHRIVKIEPHNDTNYYVTRGDNAPADDIERASFYNIVGVYNNNKIPYAGGVMDFLKTQMGIFICIVLPLALLFIWQFYKFIKVLSEGKKQKAVDEITQRLETEKQKAIEDYIAQQKAQTQGSEIRTPAPGGEESKSSGEDDAAQTEDNPEIEPAEEPSVTVGDGSSVPDTDKTQTLAEEPADDPEPATEEPSETVGDGSSVPDTDKTQTLAEEPADDPEPAAEELSVNVVDESSVPETEQAPAEPAAEEPSVTVGDESSAPVADEAETSADQKSI